MTSAPAPNILSQVEALREIGGPDDTRPVDEVLDDLDRRSLELARTLGAVELEKKREGILADVDHLRERVLEGPEAIGAFRERIADARRVLGLEAPKPIVPAHERVLVRSGQPLVHVATGFPTLDEITRGGLLARRLHVIAGEPDAGKTALALQVALHAARARVAVLWYAVDEPRDGIEDRIGQAHGLSLEDLEAGNPQAIAYLAEVLRGLPHLQIVDQAQDRLVLEDAAEMLRALQRKLGADDAMLVLDSLQTTRARAALGPQAPRGEREKLELVTGIARDIAFAGPLVLATSEVGRSAYRARNAKDRSAEMAAAKGSGAIEFYATFFGVLSRIGKGEHAGDIRLGYPKNKRGLEARGALRLEYDRDRCTYTDRGRLDEDDAPIASEKQKTAPAVADSLLERVRHQLRAHPKGVAGGAEGLASLCGKIAPARRAVRQLLATGEIEQRAGRIFHRDLKPDNTPKPEVTAAVLRDRVMEYLQAETEAGRVVPSANAILVGLRERGIGAQRTAVLDAIDVLIAGGHVVRNKRALALVVST